MDVNRDMPIFATGGYDHSIKLWQVYSGDCLRTMQHPESQVNAMDVTNDKTILAAAGYQHIRLYDMQSTTPIIDMEGYPKNVSCIGFHEDGKWMYTGGEDSHVRIYDMKTKKCERLFDCVGVNAVSLHPNQVEMVIGSQSGGVYLWDIKSDVNEQLIPEIDANVQDVAISPDGTLMASVNNKGNCHIWSLLSSNDNVLSVPQPKLKIEAHKKYALRCKFSLDSNYLVTTSGDGTARVWRTSDFTLWREFRHEKKLDSKMDLNQRECRWVWDASFTADSKYLFTVSSDCTARLWEIESKKLERVYVGHSKAITALALRE